MDIVEVNMSLFNYYRAVHELNQLNNSNISYKEEEISFESHVFSKINKH